MQKLIHNVNDAADAVADATAMTWAVFYIVQGMSKGAEAEALTACCNQALNRLAASSEMLTDIAEQERTRVVASNQGAGTSP